MRIGIVLFAVVVVASLGAAAADSSAPDPFVVRSGTVLKLAGKPFRFGGANIEWLGLVGYGPADPAGPHYPTPFEMFDAIGTAQELGARVIRSQTMGDSVGCVLCIEPSLGEFNPRAFATIDRALKLAHDLGIKVIPTIVGDDAQAGGTGCVYLAWRGIDVPNCSLTNMDPFWTDPGVIADVEQHIRVLLNHVNPYTHLAYKNDPTILGWDLLNGGGSPTPWTRTISAYVRSIDHHHLILSGAANVALKTVDACVSFVYPHWQLPLSFVRRWIDACRSVGKPYIVYEYGWDVTNYPTQPALKGFLASLRADPEIAGDAFWALQAHADGHGWMPIPADTTDPLVARTGESGEWWAMYYTGVKTLVMSAADMAARAQIIRANNFALAGRPLSKHLIPPAPLVSIAQGRIYWRGSAGARNYSIQRAPAARGPWTTICNHCVTDSTDGFVDTTAGTSAPWYRVIPYNLDGKQGHVSAPRRAS